MDRVIWREKNLSDHSLIAIRNLIGTEGLQSVEYYCYKFILLDIPSALLPAFTPKKKETYGSVAGECQNGVRK